MMGDVVKRWLKYRKELKLHLVELFLVYFALLTLIFWRLDMTIVFRIYCTGSILVFGMYVSSVLSIEDFFGDVCIQIGDFLGLLIAYILIVILMSRLLNVMWLYDFAITILPLIVVVLLMKIALSIPGSEPI